MARSKTIKEGRAPTQDVKVRCGSCDHHTRSPYYAEVCEKLGIASFAKPCPAYVVSPLAIDFTEAGSAIHMSRLMRSVKSSQLPALAAIINQGHITRKHGYYFGQPVFLRIYSPGSHLNHYASGFVIRATHKKVFIRGVDGFRAEMAHASVIDSDTFTDMRTKMIKQGRITCPKFEAFEGSVGVKDPEVIRNIGSIRIIQSEHGAIEGELHTQEMLEARKNSGQKERTVLLTGRKRMAKKPKPKPKAKAKTKAKAKA